MAVREHPAARLPVARARSKAPVAIAVEPARPRASALDALLLTSLFAVTFTRVSWWIAGLQVELPDVMALAFVVAFVASRARARDWRVPGPARVLALFFAAFSLVYLGGFFNVQTAEAAGAYVQGILQFGVRFGFLAAAVAHLARRGPRFYWTALAWLAAGFAANAVYGLLQLGLAQWAGADLDDFLLAPLGSSQAFGIDVLGDVDGLPVYRTNALTLTANHLGIALLAPVLVLLPIYLGAGRGRGLRPALLGLLVLLSFVWLTTLSRSAVVGAAAGLLVLARPYRGRLVSPRLLVAVAGLLLLIVLVGPERTGLVDPVLSARANSGGLESRTEIWGQLPGAVESHPLLGLGLNTFAVHHELATGVSKGPHSYYVGLLSETGVLGAALAACFLAYLFARLSDLRELARRLGGHRDATSALALAWGLTAALVATLAANIFLMTVTLAYFFAFSAFVLAAPLALGRGKRRAPPAEAPQEAR